jgi:four helix bundle protein
MSKHTTPSRQPQLQRRRRPLPRGGTKLVALQVADDVATAIDNLKLRRGLSHLRDHLVRAADNTSIRLSEASGHTGGNRYLHLEAAYAENQEVQRVLTLLSRRRVEVPDELARQAHRLGGLIYGLLRVE